MIEYNFGRLFTLIISALVFGALFSIFRFLTQLTFLTIKTIINAPNTIKADKLKDAKKTIRNIEEEYNTTSIGTFLYVVFWGLGFTVLSYVFLDGQIRLHFLVLCLLGYNITNRTVIKFLRTGCLWILTRTVFCLFESIIRVVMVFGNLKNVIKKQKMVAKKKK